MLPEELLIFRSVLEKTPPAVHIEPAPLLVVVAPSAPHGGDHTGREFLALLRGELQDMFGCKAAHCSSTFSRYDEGKSMNTFLDRRSTYTWTFSFPSYTILTFPIRFL